MNGALISLLTAVMVATAGLAHGATRPSSTIRISGKEYIRISDWAKANGFEMRWLKRDETLQLSNQSAKITIAVDSREAQINGVQVWLLFPLINRNGSIYLSQLDIQTLLQPILAPPKSRPGAKIQTVCLDPGHGGKDPGNRVGSKSEKTYTLLLAQEVRQQLARVGLKATLTRRSDTYPELPERPDLAKRQKADLFVSLHFNSSESGRSEVKGSEVYCLTPAGAASTNARGEGSGAGSFAGNRNNERNMYLAYQVQKALTRKLAVEDRGVRRARFAVLRDATMPAILIEAGFMSHPVEGRKIFTPEYRKQIAGAIVDGVLAYKRTVERGG